MIYISSSCVKHKKIKDSIIELADNGYQNIELSGGTEYYDGFENDILDLKKKFNLNLLCHNYFPPPTKHFVLNLASLNDDVYEKSINHIIKAIKLSKNIGALKYGFHAGFYIDIQANEIGKDLKESPLFNKNNSLERFCNAFIEIEKQAEGIKLYVENNVYSKVNFTTYRGENVLMLTDYNGYKELAEKLHINLLLDIAHLKVSSKTLGLNFSEELNKMISDCDYIHISDNDSLSDLNLSIQKDSTLFQNLQQLNLTNKDFTLEVYTGLESIKSSYNLLQELV